MSECQSFRSILFTKFTFLHHAWSLSVFETAGVLVDLWWSQLTHKHSLHQHYIYGLSISNRTNWAALLGQNDDMKVIRNKVLTGDLHHSIFGLHRQLLWGEVIDIQADLPGVLRLLYFRHSRAELSGKGPSVVWRHHHRGGWHGHLSHRWALH